MPSDLDNLEKLKEIDKAGMLEVVERFPSQFEEARALVSDVSLNIDVSQINSIVIMGMGGSGISGDIIKVFYEHRLKMPIYVSKNYIPPAFVDENSLCFVVSYSGNTEETLSSLEKALEKKSKTILVSSNGALEEKANELNLGFIKLPAGFQPRAALAYLTLPLIAVLGKLKIIEEVEGALDETASVIERIAGESSFKISLEQNSAKIFASKLYKKIPIVYGSSGVSSVAAYRWKSQLNENSKVPAFFHVFPELNHNETVGWEMLKDITQSFSLIILRDSKEPQRIKKRIEITRSLIESQFAEALEVCSRGNSDIARLFSLIYFGDFVSVYLALLNGADPTPVKRVEELKKRLSEET